MLKFLLGSLLACSSFVAAETLDCSGKTDGDYCLTDKKALYGCEKNEATIVFACSDNKVCVDSTTEVGKAKCVAQTAE